MRTKFQVCPASSTRFVRCYHYLMKIRSATGDDKESIINFFKHYGVDEIISNRVDCYISHNHTAIAEQDNKIVGIVQWAVKEDPKAGVAELEEVYVLEPYRDRGIGSLLIEHAIESIKQYFTNSGIVPRKIYLFVSEENIKARTMYEKHGFTLTAKVGHLFSDSEAELLYSKVT